jgi:hypothetical protein
MKRFLTTLCVVTIVMGGTSTDELFAAHHGRGETYISGMTKEIEGTVKEVLWRNPHVAILIDVAGDNGEVTTWTIEHSNVSTLARLGYGRQTLKPGMDVTAVIFPGSMDRPIGLCSRIILEDGTQVFMRGGNDSDRYNPLTDFD